MKKVMTGAAIVAVVGIAGAGGAAAAQPSPKPPRQDCRTYSSVTECGTPTLTERQQACVTAATRQGMTQRRAEAECRAFP